MAAQPPSVTIGEIEFDPEKAEHGLAMPYDAERVGQLRKMLVEARKRKLSAGAEGEDGSRGGDDPRHREAGSGTANPA